MRHRVTAAAMIVPLVLTAGCTSSTKSHSPATQGSSPSSASSSAAAALAAKLHAALAGITSTAVVIDAGGLIAPTTGHITLADGKATALDISIGTGSDATRVIIVGTNVYAKPPASQYSGSKPYLKVSATSSNEFARGLASTVEILQAAASLGDLADLVATAGAFTDKGTAMVGSTSAEHYAFTVLGNAHGSPLQQQLADLGTRPVAVDLYVDGQNRPIEVSLGINVGGTPIAITATLSQFNAPVTITAPPANQVASS
jgi:hypothetical protein